MSIIKGFTKVEIKNQEEVFHNRKVIGDALVWIIKEKGYSKSTFSKIVGISSPALDKMIKGEVCSKNEFLSHMKKIFESEIVTIDELINYKGMVKDEIIIPLDNASSGCERNYRTKELFMILDDLINLSEIYQ